MTMRTLLLAAFMMVTIAGPAVADQYDPALDALFDELRSASAADIETTETEIERLWLSAPEAGTAIIVERVVTAIENEDYAVAETLVDHLTTLAPSFAEGFVFEGQLALVRQDETTARRAFARAVRLEPRHYRALERLGDLALARGDREEAYQHYRDALSWNPHLEGLRTTVERLRVELAGREI